RAPAAQPGIIQRLVERRLTNVELRTIFFILLAVCALALILFFLFRGRAGKTGGKAKKGQPAGAGATPVPDDRSRATVVETPAAQPEGPPPPGHADSPVRFPPSLERKFTGAECIGEGGLARVFRAENAKTGILVAVKVPVRFDETTGTHFTRDITLWERLVHKNIIRMYSYNILPIPYIEMEYAPSSLAAVKFPVSEERALGIIAGVAHGLAYAHGLGIVHRDIKPENILIASDGTPKITDWGLGKAIGDPRQSVMISFSPAYAAPEQIDPQRFGRPGPQTDIYQLGVLLFEMLTGTVPFSQIGFSDMNHAILSEEPSVPSWEGKRLDQIRAVIARCLSKRPADRFGSVAEFLAALGLPETGE
ncbi:MAG TPA: serine/threonine-protein kinase, partial [Methanoregula sp.]|nr:serine/threonine-protein kinase [Methanoregula sp.]